MFKMVLTDREAVTERGDVFCLCAGSLPSWPQWLETG